MMKKIIYLLGTALIISVLLFSCEKDSISDLNGDKLEIRNSVSGGVDEIEFAINQFAHALALSMQNNEDMRTFIFNQSGFGDNLKGDLDYRLFNEELILSCLRHKAINSGETFESVIDSTLSEIDNGMTLDQVITLQPDLMIKIPDRFVKYHWDLSNPDHTPYVKAYSSLGFLYYKDDNILTESLITKYGEPFYIRVRKTEKNVLVNKNDFTIYGQDLTLKDIYGDVLDSCQEWITYIDSLGSCSELFNYSFVNVFKLQDIINNCFQPPSDTLVLRDAPIDPFCKWTSHREVDWRYHTNDSKWVGMKLASLATYNELNNCGDNDRDQMYFRFDYVAVASGVGIENYSRRFVLHENDLLHPQETVSQSWFNVECLCKITVTIITKEAEPKYAKLPQKIRFFGNSKVANNWMLDDQGEAFMLGITKFNNKSCLTTTTESERKEYSINLDVNVYDILEYATGKFKWGYSHSKSLEHKYVVKGYDVIEIDRSPLNFCEQETAIQDFEVGGMIELRVENEIHDF